MQLLVIIVLAVSVLSAVSASGEVLRSDWPPAGATNKRFYIEILNKAGWMEAYMYCLRNNSRLARIESEEENNLVVGMIKDLRVPTVDLQHYWLGATDFTDLGNYFWMSTGEYVSGFSDWEPGQGREGGHRCLRYWQLNKDRFKWDDFNCDWKHAFVCEYYQ